MMLMIRNMKFSWDSDMLAVLGSGEIMNSQN